MYNKFVMNKVDKTKLSILILLIICTIAIVVSCVVFVNRENNGSGNSNNSSDVSFNYGSSIVALLGDNIDLSPKEENISLIYSSSNKDVLSVSQNGIASTKKCGNVDVKIYKDKNLVKSVNIIIKTNYTIELVSNCTYNNKTFTLSAKTACFKLIFVNSSNSTLNISFNFNFEYDSGISIMKNLSGIWITADNNGSFTIKDSNLNISLTFNVIKNY